MRDIRRQDIASAVGNDKSIARVAPSSVSVERVVIAAVGNLQPIATVLFCDIVVNLVRATCEQYHSVTAILENGARLDDRSSAVFKLDSAGRVVSQFIILQYVETAVVDCNTMVSVVSRKIA